ncbi:MAG: C10 family peptidase, partial [Candidatus Cloacimonetes bacterium]|nr:C10 family peptidase [Candidatus Cloacimonadota bacterium]
MKKLFLMTFALLVNAMIFGGINADLAKQIGEKLLSEIAADQQLVIDRITGTIEHNESNIIYIMSLAPHGWLIVSGEQKAYPVLAYSLEGDFEYPNVNPAALDWVEYVADQIRYAVDHEIEVDESIMQEWEHYLAEDFLPRVSDKSTVISTKIDRVWDEGQHVSISEGLVPNIGDGTRDVDPLLETTWGQGTYYNAQCPSDTQGPGGHALVGCVATAMAQVMKYWRCPQWGIGSHSYIHPVYGIISANFSNGTYYYNGMPNSINSHDTDVAKISFHAGVSVEMDYGPSGSGAYPSDVPSALESIFRYSTTAQDVQRSSYTESGWNQLIRNEMNAGRPVIYSGWDPPDGHTFVVDGLQGTTSFHVNWGWNGSQNGYFQLSALNAGGYSWNSYQRATIGISPTFPSEPTGEHAEAISSSAIDITWNDTSNNESGFAVYRGLQHIGTYYLVESVGANVEICHDTGLDPGTHYYYFVLAYNAAGNWPTVTIVDATTPGGDVEISGYVTNSLDDGVDNISVVLSNNGGSDDTNSYGYYHENVPYGWSGTITPSIACYPASISITNATSDVDNQNFLADDVTIEGYVRDGNSAGIADVDIDFNNGEGSENTPSTGYYNEPVAYGWSGRATPTKTGYTFSPEYVDYNNVTSDRTDNYTGALISSPVISGYVKTPTNVAISGVTMTFSNNGGSVTTDGNGFYTKTITSGWSGTVTPSKTGYTFDPPNRSYTNVTTTQPNQNYTGTPPPRPRRSGEGGKGAKGGGSPG